MFLSTQDKKAFTMSQPPLFNLEEELLQELDTAEAQPIPTFTSQDLDTFEQSLEADFKNMLHLTEHKKAMAKMTRKNLAAIFDFVESPS